MTLYPKSNVLTALDYIKIQNKFMGRESRVPRTEPKTVKRVKPVKKRYSEHLKNPTPMDYAKPRGMPLSVTGE